MEKELYKNKYLKYKKKYLDLKYMFGGDNDLITYTTFFKEIIDLYKSESVTAKDEAIEKRKKIGNITKPINYNKETYNLSDKKILESIKNGISIIFKNNHNIKFGLPNNTISAEFYNFNYPIGKYKKQIGYDDYERYLYNPDNNKYPLTNLDFYHNFNQPLGEDIKTYLPPNLTDLRLLCNTFNQPLGYGNTSYLPSTLRRLVITNTNFSQPLGVDSNNTIYCYLPTSLSTIHINYNYDNIIQNLKFFQSRTFLNNETGNFKYIFLSKSISDSEFNEIKNKIITAFREFFPDKKFDDYFIISKQIKDENCNN